MKKYLLYSLVALVSLGFVLAVGISEGHAMPIAVGPDRSAGIGLGFSKYFQWYGSTSTGGCVNGANGSCVDSFSMKGDTYFFTAWVPSSTLALLPTPSGLPVIGTVNDGHPPGCASVNLSVVQLDTWSWGDASSFP